MSLEDFRKDFLEDVKISSSEDKTNLDLVFTESVVNTLIDAEEFDDFVYGYFNGVGNYNRKMTMDGFYYDSYDKSMVILYSDFSNSDDIVFLFKSDIDKDYSCMRHLVEACENDFILNNGFEESSAGYELATIIKSKKDEIIKYRFYIITDKVLNIKGKNLKQEKINSKIVDLNIWDMKRLYNLYLSSQMKESIDIFFDDDDLKCINAVNEDTYKAYLAVIPGDKLADMYIEYGSRLLEGNVRSFLSTKGKVNKGIRNTILNEPGMFFAYNNGIAATATEIELSENGNCIKRIKDLQIINGGQTTASIANVVLQDKKNDAVKKVFVPMKISIVDNDKANEMIPQISRCANSQNKVDESDFFSNHPYHIRIEEYSRKIFAPPINGNLYETIWFYERAKGQYTQEQMKLTSSEKKKFQIKNPKNQVLKKVDVAKYINTFDCHPDIVSKGAQACMRYFAEMITKKWDNSNSEYNDAYYKKLISYAIIFKGTEKLVADQDWYKEIKAYRANIVTYSIAVIVDRIKKLYPNLSIDYKKIWNEQKIYVALYNQLLKTTKEMLEFITRDDRLTLNVTEWCKKEECWKRASNYKFELLDSFVESLIDSSIIKQDEIDSKKDRKLENQLSDDVEVINLGQEYWEKVLKWGLEQKILNPFEIDLLRIASTFMTTMKIPTSKQCSSLLMIRDRLLSEGMPNKFN
jgi:hypothetical protein